tara:strand:+ start:137 stop:322 length:186 start_codon:yes stop_codon:yes gene_type:complete
MFAFVFVVIAVAVVLQNLFYIYCCRSQYIITTSNAIVDKLGSYELYLCLFVWKARYEGEIP